MTALADQLAAIGKYPTSAIADLAITAGSVVRDGNGQVRVAGSPTAIQADIVAASQVAALTPLPGFAAPPHKGQGNNKW